MEDFTNEFIIIITTYGLDVIGAIIILLIGYILSKRVPAILLKVMNKKGIDPTVGKFMASLTKFMILAVTFIFVLSQFGVQTASLIAVLGAAGLAIGLALQGTLSNVAGGVMLLIFRPMKVGDFVDTAGHAGTIKSIGLFTTEMATGDNVQIIIPNGSVWGSAIRNFSFHPTRRLDLVMGIAYEDDIDKAQAVMAKVILADDRSHKDPAPLIEVGELADSSVNFVIRVWCDSGDYWALKWALTKAIKQAFDAEEISIPYPQRVVHMQKDA